MNNEELMTYMIVCSWLVLILVLLSLRQFITSKRRYWETLTKKEKEPKDIMTRVSMTASMMKLVDLLIEIEIDTMITSLNLIRKPYDMLRIDKDVQYISERVFNSIKKDIYVDKDHCLTEEYLLQFITNEVSNKFIQSMVSNNMKLYVSNAENNPEE